MKRLLTVLVASLALVLAVGVGTAWAGGLPGGELPAGQSQSIDQSQNATNSIDQTANAQSVAVNASPNVAVANSGSVDQSSNASSGAAAVNKNDSQQSNTLQNNAEQSQSGASADDNKGSCCERTSKRHGSQTQNADQSQDAGNSISQNAHAKSVAVNASPNVAVLNKGGECNCGGGVNQSSNASSAAIAANKNNSTQSNTLQNNARQSQGGSNAGGGDPSQSIDQSQDASNSIDQHAKATSVAVNVSPNVAIANSGPVKQDSNASSEAVAVNKNESQQSNTLQNDADQSQTGTNDACGGRCEHGSAPQSQDLRQSQNASNSISQNAESRSFALNASPNVALLNGGHDKCGGCGNGDVQQSSDASSGAFAGNWNSSEQSNDLGQDARQSQDRGSGSCCGKGGEQSQSIDQSQDATNSISQKAETKSAAVNISPNIAAFNRGSVEQSSGASSEAIAANRNDSTQSNNLWQSADQQQRGGDDCGCCDECEGRCED